MAVSLDSSILSQYTSIAQTTTSVSSTMSSALNVSSDSSDEDLKTASKQFEQYLIEQMIKEVKETMESDDDDDDSSSSDYVDMFSDTAIESIAEELENQGGLGLADQFYENLTIQSKNIAIPVVGENTDTTVAEDTEVKVEDVGAVDQL